MPVEWEDASLRQLIDELPDLVCRFTPDGTLLYVNRAYARYHDSEPEAMVGQRFLNYVHPDLRPGIEAALESMRHITPDNPVRRNTHQTMSTSGNLRWHEWTDRAFFDVDGRLLGFMSIGRDQTDVIDKARAVQHDLLHDELTEVLNRRGLFAMLGDLLVKVDQPFLVGFVDIDHFKRINDDFGHREGDHVLKRVANGLRNLDDDAMVGRIGGDEFVVVLTGINESAQGPLLSAHLNNKLQSRVPQVSVSCGWAVAEPGDTADEVVHAADHDMYRRKAADGASVHDPSTRVLRPASKGAAGRRLQ